MRSNENQLVDDGVKVFYKMDDDEAFGPTDDKTKSEEFFETCKAFGIDIVQVYEPQPMYKGQRVSVSTYRLRLGPTTDEITSAVASFICSFPEVITRRPRVLFYAYGSDGYNTYIRIAIVESDSKTGVKSYRSANPLLDAHLDGYYDH